MRSWSYLDHPGPIPFAHRGGALVAPENSFEAFEAVIKSGFRYVETDVHVTTDGVLVAFHDAILDRVTDRVGTIADMSWNEVRRAKIDGTGTIPLFEDLLGSWPDVRINVDPKDDRAVVPLARTLQRALAVDRVCVGAFSDARIAHTVNIVGPRLCTGMGPRAVALLRAASLGIPVGTLVGSCAQVPTEFRGLSVVTPGFVAEAHRRGIAVHVWTVDVAEDMHRLLDLGVDGLMTDRPGVLRGVLEERGQWV